MDIRKQCEIKDQELMRFLNDNNFEVTYIDGYWVSVNKEYGLIYTDNTFTKISKIFYGHLNGEVNRFFMEDDTEECYERMYKFMEGCIKFFISEIRKNKINKVI